MIGETWVFPKVVESLRKRVETNTVNAEQKKSYKRTRRCKNLERNNMEKGKNLKNL